MRTAGAPSHNRYSPFRCEEGTIVDVNRKTWTVKVETRHSAKPIEDIQVIAPYHHFLGGEGVHHLPEVGAQVLVGWPNDNTPPFVMGYLGVPSALDSTDNAPERSTSATEGSQTDVSFKSRRPDLNPGDIAFTTRDGNFLYLRRGGVIQIGATSIAQRIYIPVLNFIKDFCENYEMQHFGGDIAWTVERSESDPGGNAPATYAFRLNEFAQDAKASVQIRHMPVAAPGGGSKSAWEVTVAPQGISREDGSVENQKYSMLIMMDGEKTEIIGAARTVEVKGNDSLTVHGDRTVQIDGKEKTTVGGDVEHVATGTHVVGGAVVKQGSAAAADPAVLGNELVQWLSTTTWIVAGTTATPSPAAILALANILSRKVFLE